MVRSNKGGNHEKKIAITSTSTMLSIFVLTACGGASNGNTANNEAAFNNAAANAGEEKTDGEKLKIGFCNR